MLPAEEEFVLPPVETLLTRRPTLPALKSITFEGNRVASDQELAAHTKGFVGMELTQTRLDARSNLGRLRSIGHHLFQHFLPDRPRRLDFALGEFFELVVETAGSGLAPVVNPCALATNRPASSRPNRRARG